MEEPNLSILCLPRSKCCFPDSSPDFVHPLIACFFMLHFKCILNVIYIILNKRYALINTLLGCGKRACEEINQPGKGRCYARTRERTAEPGNFRSDCG